MTSVQMKRRINSRCNGLLEIDEPATISGETWRVKYRQLDRLISEAEAGDSSVLPTLYSYGHSLARSNVQYLHRTVKDYLEAPDIWRSIESAAPTEEKDCWILSLCLGCVMLWKNSDEDDHKIQGAPLPEPQRSFRVPTVMPSILPLPPGFPLEPTNPSLRPVQLGQDRRKDRRLVLENCFRLATSIYPHSVKTYTRLLDAIGTALFDAGLADVECNRPEVLSSAIWKHETLGFVFENFLSLAVHLNLYHYVGFKLSNLKQDIQTATASRLLIVAVLKRHQWLKQTSEAFRNDHGKFKRFNATYQNFSDASWLLETPERAMARSDREETDPSFRIVQILMEHQADLDFQAYGTSARKVMDLRRSDLSSSPDFEKISQRFGFINKSAGLSRRTKGVLTDLRQLTQQARARD